MYVLKSFLKIDALINNQVNTIAPIGELSDLGSTYSKNKGNYTDSVNYPGLELISFTSNSDDAGPTQKVEMQERVKEFLFKTAEWMNNTAAITPQWFNTVDGTAVFVDEWQDAISGWSSSPGNVLPGPITSYADVNIQAVSEDYEVVDVDGDDKYYVKYVQFEMDYEYDGETRTAQVKLWLSDSSFRLEYDDYEIVVVPMVSDIDDFFDTYANVQILVNAANVPSNVVSRFETAKGDYPPTIQKLLNYNWHDGELPPNTISVPWGVIIYGIAGDNLDLIRQALRDYILDNSTHNEPAWSEIFPGIFRVSEFILVPMWHRYAIPNALMAQGIYSPVVSLYRDKAILQQVCPAISMGHIEEFAESFVFPYKSIAIFSIPSEFNNEDLMRLQVAVPNFAHISTNTYDFSRMNLEAQDWMSKISVAIIAAESMTQISSLPLGTSRVYRNGVMFIGLEINEKTYLVASKKFFNDTFEDILASDEA